MGHLVGGRGAGERGGGGGGEDRNAHEPLEFSKAPFIEMSAPRRIKSVKFSLMSSQEIARCGVFHVSERNLYHMPQRVPLKNGILDPRMGTTDKKGGECATCKGKLIDCAGTHARATSQKTTKLTRAFMDCLFHATLQCQHQS